MSPPHLGAVMLWEGGEKVRESVWVSPCECVFSLLSVSAVCRWRMEQQPHLSFSSVLRATGWKAIFFTLSIFPSIPPANVKACLHQWRIQQRRLRTRNKRKKKTCILLEEGAYPRRDIVLILFLSGVLMCGIHLRRAKQLHVCECVGPVCVSHPSPLPLLLSSFLLLHGASALS